MNSFNNFPLIVALCFFFFTASNGFNYETNEFEISPNSTQKISSKNSIKIPPELTCFLCRVIARGILDAYLTQNTEDCIAAIVTEFCETFNIEDTMVCQSIASQFKVLLLFNVTVGGK